MVDSGGEKVPGYTHERDIRDDPLLTRGVSDTTYKNSIDHIIEQKTMSQHGELEVELENESGLG